MWLLAVTSDMLTLFVATGKGPSNGYDQALESLAGHGE